MDVKYHSVQERNEEGEIDVDYISSAIQIADGLTKPLQRVKFERFRFNLGMF